MAGDRGIGELGVLVLVVLVEGGTRDGVSLERACIFMSVYITGAADRRYDDNACNEKILFDTATPSWETYS